MHLRLRRRSFLKSLLKSFEGGRIRHSAPGRIQKGTFSRYQKMALHVLITVGASCLQRFRFSGLFITFVPTF